MNEITYKSNPEAEGMVLGLIMLDSTIGFNACLAQGVTENTFYDRRTRTIYAAMQVLASKNRPIDTLTVANQLSQENADIDSMYLSNLVGNTTTVYHIDYYIELICEREYIRNIEHQAMISLQQCRDGEPSHEIASTMLSVLTVQTRKLQVLTLKNLRDDKIRQWQKARKVGFIGIPSCFNYVNQFLGGYRRGVHTILGGFRGEGKSTIARQEALSMAKADISVLLISLEDPADVAGAGIVGNHGDFSVFQHDIGHGTDDSIREAEEAWDEISNIPLYITNEPMNISQVCSTVTAIKARYDIQIVFLDHIQYILSGRRFPSRNDEITYFSQQICALAKRLNVAFVSLSQFSRSAERENREPRLSDLRDSGSIEQDARAVLLLSWDADEKKHILKIAKNNYGPSGARILMERIGNRQRFNELSLIENETDLPQAS